MLAITTTRQYLYIPPRLQHVSSSQATIIEIKPQQKINLKIQSKNVKRLHATITDNYQPYGLPRLYQTVLTALLPSTADSSDCPTASCSTLNWTERTEQKSGEREREREREREIGRKLTSVFIGERRTVPQKIINANLTTSNYHKIGP